MIKLLPLLMLCLLAVVSNASALQSGDFTYTINDGDTNTVTITDYTGSGGAVEIPSTITEKSVTAIEKFAFSRSNLTSVSIPDSVTTMGRSAFFGCDSLTNVTMGSGVTTIERATFYECYKLTTVTIGSGVTYIGDFAFRQCGLPSITIPDNVNNIAGSTFFRCSSLTNVTIGAGVTNIDNYAFYECNSLMTIMVDSSNLDYSSVDGVLFNKNLSELILYPAKKSGNYYSIPDSVISVGLHAFRWSSLTSVRIPDSISSIGPAAFEFSSLTSVTIPDSVTLIEEYAFFGCYSLKNLTMGSGVTNITDAMFSNCDSLTGVYFVGNAPSYVSSVFADADDVVVYYPLGTTGWGATFDGRPAVLWDPLIESGDGNFGVQTNGFGFNITESESGLVVVEACTNLIDSIWEPIQTNTMTGGSVYFSDLNWTNHPCRYYRLSMP